jgi:hypothetical protein
MTVSGDGSQSCTGMPPPMTTSARAASTPHSVSCLLGILLLLLRGTALDALSLVEEHYR